MKKVAKELVGATTESLKSDESDSQNERVKKDALGFLELFYSFVAYHQIIKVI